MRISGRILLVVLAAAGLASGLSTVLAMQYVRSTGEEYQLSRLAILNGTFWYGLVLLSAPLVVLSRRFRVDRRPWLAVPIHVVALLLVAAAHAALQAGAQVVVSWRAAASDNMAADFPWLAQWMAIFPLTLTRLFDWELLAGAAIVAMAHAFFYYRESQQRALREAQLETSLVEARLQALQHQLHPHFLFNTLHAISTLMHRDVNAADEMLVQLSDLLRLTLDRVGTQQVPLNDEVDFLRKYLEIEQTRVGDRLQVNIDIEPELLDAPVPSLILQPLVENALRHGIGPKVGVGCVDVQARQEGGALILTVRDNGVGLPPDKLHAFHSGVGLSNTRSRLENLYGDRHRFEFQTPPAGGLQVTIVVPLGPDGESRSPSSEPRMESVA